MFYLIIDINGIYLYTFNLFTAWFALLFLFSQCFAFMVYILPNLHVSFAYFALWVYRLMQFRIDLIIYDII